MTGSASQAMKIPPRHPFPKGGLGGFKSYWFEVGLCFWLRLCRAMVSYALFYLFLDKV
jgi:hypothetical protein